MTKEQHVLNTKMCRYPSPGNTPEILYPDSPNPTAPRGVHQADEEAGVPSCRLWKCIGFRVWGCVGIIMGLVEAHRVCGGVLGLGV